MENDYIDLGNNIYLYYDFDIYSATTGSDIEMSAYIVIYENIQTKSNLYIYDLNALATITKVGDVGEYIEGTFEGDFDYDKKGVIPPFHVKGKFKVKRVEEPTVY